MFDKTRPRFPLKPAHDGCRESILLHDDVLGRSAPPLGLEVPLFAPPPAGDAPVSPRGDSSSSSSPPKPIEAEETKTITNTDYNPEVIRAFPDDMQFDMLDPEVIGKYTPVRKNSRRVPDIPEGPEWNEWNDARKRLEVGHLYPERCELRRKDKIKRLRDKMQARLPTPSFVSYSGCTKVRLSQLSALDLQTSGSIIFASDPIETEEKCLTASPQTPKDKVAWENLKGSHVPQMPINSRPPPEVHRDHVPDYDFPLNILVTEPAFRAQRKAIPKVQEACNKEWETLTKRDTWDPASVREWNVVCLQAKQQNYKVHVACIFEICVVKGLELSDSDPRKIYKGRAVLDGSWVKDDNYDVALFNDLGSSPANMQAGKVVDAFGLQPDYVIQQADAEAAYTQCELKCTPTWVRLPEERWPDEWFYISKTGERQCKHKDPVCMLKKASYGHPDAGTYWEQHAETHLESVGFTPIPDWRSCFVHPVLRLYLIVYVDDFKLAGPANKIAEGWR